PETAPAGSAWADWATAAAIFIVTLLIYLVSPVVTSSDAMFAMHVAASFYNGLHGEVSAWLPAIHATAAYRQYGLPYQLVTTPTGIYSKYPDRYALDGRALCGAQRCAWRPSPQRPRAEHRPLARPLRRVGDERGRPAVLYLAMRRREASVTAALLATTAFMLGTPLWSTASRGLWQHGPLILCFSLAIFFLSRKPIRLIDAAAAGFALGYAVLTRQTAGLALLAIALALLSMNWRAAFVLGLAAVPPMLVNVAYDLHAFNWIGNPYVSQYADSAAWSWTAFSGLIVSPQRGLLIFSPILLFAGYGFVHLVRERRASSVDYAYLAYCLGLWLFLACWPAWHGGYSYGPRMMSDPLPFLVLYLAPAWDTMARRAALPAMAGFVFLLTISCAIHARGATDWDVWRWNVRPDLEARLWDWRDLQILYSTGRTDHPTLEGDRKDINSGAIPKAYR
ncbi:MAG: hypothetical protein WBW08_06610, partial [Methyloceanibacter sp.]